MVPFFCAVVFEVCCGNSESLGVPASRLPLKLFGSCGGQRFFETHFIAIYLLALLLLHGCFIGGGPLGAVAAANTH